MSTRRQITLLCTLAATLMAFAPTATAADVNPGDAVVVPTGQAGKGLRVKGVRLAAIKPAKVVKGGVKIPVTDLTFPAPGRALAVTSGGFRLKAGAKKVEVRGLLVKLTPAKVTVSAKVGRKRLELFSAPAGKRTSIDTGNSRFVLNSKALKLTGAGAAALRKALANRRFKTARLGTFTGRASVYFPPLIDGGPTGPANQLPWEPPVLPTRPAGAIDASAQPVEWWARDSWVNYVGQPAQVSGGAVALPAVTNDPGHVCPSSNADGSRVGNYAFTFPFSSGWWDSASGTGFLQYLGTVRFYYPQRFDMSFSDPQIVIRPGGTTMNFRITDADYPAGLNAEMFTVDAGLAPGGARVKFGNTLTQVGMSGPFGGMYPAGAPWGCMYPQFTV